MPLYRDSLSSSLIGTANGVASLGSDGKVPSGQLPASVTGEPTLGLLAKMPMLGGIAKARTGKWRLLMGGTSKTSFQNSANKVWAESLKALYGDAGTTYLSAGVLGGSWENAFQGWSKQPYGGLTFTRAVGTSASSDLVRTFHGDTLELYFSRESDSAATQVLVDGVEVATSPTSGAQAYGIKTVVTGLTATTHTLTIVKPSSGKVYFEAFIASFSARTGVEVIDATLGGSALGNMLTVRTPTGAQVTGIAIQPGVGVGAWTGFECDAAWFGWLVNDAGGNISTSNYQTTWETICDSLFQQSRPVGVAVEMAGHYARPQSDRNAKLETLIATLRGLDSYSNVTVFDFDKATRLADMVEYAATYFPGMTWVDVSAGTFTGDFIHENTTATAICTALMCQATGVPTPKAYNITDITQDRLNAYADPKTVIVTTPGGKRIAPIEGIAVKMVSSASPDAAGLQAPFVRDPLIYNKAASRQRLIDETPTGTDAYGPYRVLTDSNGVGTLASGSTHYLTIRFTGLLRVRLDTYKARINGLDIPSDSFGSTNIHSTYSYATPQVFTAEIYGSGNIAFAGNTARIYEISVVEADTPVLCGPTTTYDSPGRVPLKRRVNRATTATSPATDATGLTLDNYGLYLVTAWAQVSGETHSVEATWLVRYSDSSLDILSTAMLGSVRKIGWGDNITLSNPDTNGKVYATATWTGGSTGVTFQYTAVQIA